MSGIAKVYKVGNFTGDVGELAAYFGINRRTLASRLRKGWPVDQACHVPVEKKKSFNLPSCLDIGNYHDTYDNAMNWFGVKFGWKECRNSDLAIDRLRRWRDPKFYKVGDSYVGSLYAISEDFNCSVAVLRKGIKDGKEPEEILREGGFLEKYNAGD